MSDLDSLNEKIKEIESTKEKEINALRFDYVVKKRRFKVGDILKDGRNAIVVDKIRWSSCSNGGAPFSVYIGRLLTKKLQPRKDGEMCKVYGKEVVKLEKGE